MGAFPVRTDGSVDAVDNGTVAYIRNGLAFDSTGKLVITTTNAEAVVHNGFSMDSAGRIRVSSGTRSYTHNDFDFDTQGRLLISTTDPGLASVHGGLRRGAAGLFVTGGGGDGGGVNPVTTGLGIQWDPTALGLANGDPVASFTDMSGNGVHATQATSASRPTFTTGAINGKSALSFDCVDDFLIFTMPAYTAASIFIVADGATDSVQANSGLWQVGSGASTHMAFDDGIAYDGALSTSRQTLGNLTASFSDPFLYSVASGAGDWRAYMNGTSVFTTASNTVGFSGAAARLGINSGGNLWRGLIGEVLLYTRVLTTVERDSVTSYLKTKWGVV